MAGKQVVIVGAARTPVGAFLGSLGMSRSVCWYSWEEQVSSLERLLDLHFRFVLPGHGRRAEARDAGEMRGWIQKLLREVQ